jgi:hypothetical protein
MDALLSAELKNGMIWFARSEFGLVGHARPQENREHFYRAEQRTSAGAKGQFGSISHGQEFLLGSARDFLVRDVLCGRFTGYLCPSSRSRVGTS